MTPPHKKLFSSLLGGIVTIAAIAGMTIVADLVPSFKDWLKNTFTHHWIGKGVIAIVTFIVVTIGGWFLPYSVDEKKIQRAIGWLSAVLILGALAILAFFIFEAKK